MRVFVKWEVFGSISDDEGVKRTRQVLGKQFQEIRDSGKFVEGGVFADARAGYLVLDLGESSELMDLIGGPILDHCHVKTHPLVSFEYLREFFGKHPIE